MDLRALRHRLKQDQIELDLSLLNAVTEARKDGLTSDDLEEALLLGEVIEACANKGPLKSV